MPASSGGDPSAALAALSSLVLEGLDLDAVLTHVAQSAVGAISGADEASVSVIRDGVATTFGATSGTPLAADERQYEAGMGPCLNGAQANQTVLITEMATDTRWPA